MKKRSDPPPKGPAPRPRALATPPDVKKACMEWQAAHAPEFSDYKITAKSLLLYDVGIRRPARVVPLRMIPGAGR